MADIRIKDLATTAASTASDDFVAVDGSANGTRKLNAYSPTFGGNLTVSGTGTNNFVGDVVVTNGANPLLGAVDTRASGSGGRPALTLNTSDQAWQIQNSGGNIVFRDNTVALNAATIAKGTGNATLAGNLTVSGTGNSSVAGTLLVATTTNSSNGKLQLADHTTSAGGIGFGTEVSLYRQNTGTLRLENSTGGCVFAVNGNSGNTRAVIFYGSGTEQAAVRVDGGGTSLELCTGASRTIALTLDSSQNATFAGKVTVSKANAGLDTSVTVNNTDSAANSTSSLILTSVAGSWTIQNNRSGGHLYFKDPATSATQLQINNSTGLATFSGSIAIGNTVQSAVAIASTHKVTISIGGSTYYLLATNV